jgi:hemolysin activation/secretion protein
MQWGFTRWQVQLLLSLMGGGVVIGAPGLVLAQEAPTDSQTLAKEMMASPRDANEANEKVPVSVETNAESDRANIDSETKIQVGAVKISGGNLLSQSSFAEIADKYVGQSVDKSGLQELARAIADQARSKGFIFASAAIPAQAVDMGIVQVDLNEGDVDDVRIRGTKNRRVRSILNELIGKGVQREVVERAILIAGDVPGIDIVKTNYVRENGRGVLIVTASEDRSSAQVRLDNYGTNSTGPLRARLGLELNGLITSDDSVTVNVIGNPVDPKELVYVSAQYSVGLGNSGATAAIAAGSGRTEPGGRRVGFESIGHSSYLSASITAPIIRSNAANLFVSGELTYFTVDQNYIAFGLERDDIVTFTASAWGNIRLAGGRASAGVSISRGLGIFGATALNDPRSSRSNGSGQFTKLNSWMNWTGDLGGDFSLRLAMNAQIASRPLLSSQTIGIGGPAFGRGYDFSERVGDNGILGIVELRRNFDKPLPFVSWAQVYGFVDGGYVYDLRDAGGGSSLYSAGGGIRSGLGDANLAFQVAMPINEARGAAGDKSPHVNFSVGYDF